jgi:hypothetical protein
LVIRRVRQRAVNPKSQEDIMKTTAKHHTTRGQGKRGDLAPRRNRAQAVKGGIIIIGGVPQLRAATVDPLTIRGLNPQPLPPRL